MTRLADVTDSEYQTFSEFNRKMVEKFLKQKGATLSPQSLKQYRSGMRHLLRWLHDEQDDKDIVKLKSRHGGEYITYLDDAGLSPAALRFKVAAASSLCGYIVRFFDDDYPSFKNVFQGVEKPSKSAVHEKHPLTPQEFTQLVNTLAERRDYQKLAYILFSYSSGCRRAEVRQLLKEVITYEHLKDKNGAEKPYYMTHKIRCKGRGRNGKIRNLQLDESAMTAIKKWLEVRGDDDCPYVFVTKSRDGVVRQISETTFNYWCTDVFSKILEKRVHPHCFRSSRATNLNDSGVDIKSIQSLLGHESSETTSIYIVRDQTEDIDDVFG
jgi:site-specific recombinase XerD